MKITPNQILTKLGFNIPDDGITINPDDAHLHMALLKTMGESMDVLNINEEKLNKLASELYGSHNRSDETNRYKGDALKQSMIIVAKTQYGLKETP